MTDLIIHIGLSKTGTTTIQKKVLQSFPGYIGRKEDNDDDVFRQEFSALTPSDSLQQWEKNIKLWADRLIQHKEQKYPEAEKLIISDENLSRITPNGRPQRPIGPDTNNLWGIKDRHPIVKHLAKLREGLWPYGETKVLFTIRNQPDWLGSTYAQSSHMMRKPSQKDFEGQVRRVLETGDNYIDWSSWIDELEHAVGSQNVGILLMEEMAGFEYWRDIESFLGIEGEGFSQYSMGNSPKENARRVSPSSWGVRKFTGHTAKARKYFTYEWGKGDGPVSRRVAYSGSVMVTRYILDPFTRVIDNPFSRPDKISMSEGLRKEIVEYCKPFNEKLAKQLGRTDLAEKGY